MAIQLTINGTTYNFPENGEDASWGEELSSWATAVTESLNTLLGEGDILETPFTLPNNISSDTEVVGLFFNPALVRAANIDYTIYRISDTNPSGYAEVGKMFLIYDDSATVGQKWQLSQTSAGNSGVMFSIQDNGQIYFKSSDIGSTGYYGLIKFRAKALLKI